MGFFKTFSTILGSGILLGLCGAASAQDLGALKGMAGGGDMSSMASGSAGNAAGIIFPKRAWGKGLCGSRRHGENPRTMTDAALTRIG